MRAPRLLAASLLVAVLAGCVVGPDDQPTDQPEESSAANESADTNATSGEPVLFPQPANGTDNVTSPTSPTPAPEESTTPTPTSPAPTPTPTPTEPAPTPPAPTPTQPTPSPPPATPSPTPTPPSPTPPPPTQPTPTPTPPSPEPPAWPREGSFVKYRYSGGENSPDPTYSISVRADIELRYTGGRWTGTCEGTREEVHRQYNDATGSYDETWTNTTFEESVAFAPLVAPTDVQPGQTVTVPMIVRCDRTSMDVPVESRTTHSAPRQADGSDVWYAHYEPPWPQEQEAWWDTRTGLVLAYDDQRRNSGDHGWMVDTDAPLS